MWKGASCTLIVLLGLGVSGEARAGKQIVVDLTDRPPYMTPLSVRASVGDTIIFKNHGPEMVHSITDDGLVLHSGDIPVGGQWSYNFVRAGEYPYVCYRHHFMRGSVLVANADGSTTAKPQHAYQEAFQEFVIPTLKAVPRMIIPSRTDDTMWFTEGGGDFYGFESIPANNKIGQIDDTGRIVEYATPTPGSDGSKVAVDSLVMDYKGAIWFTERLTSRLGRLGPDGRITEVALPTPNSQPLGIDISRDGRLWFAERSGNRIGFLTPDGKITEIPLPGENSEPRTVYVDRKQRVWYTARAANEIGYYEPKTKKLVRLQIPTQIARPTGVAETKDGSIYFVQMVGNKIGKVVGDQIVEYALPTKFAAPFKIVADEKDRLWFTEVFGNAIGMMDPRTGKVLEYKIPTPDSRPGGLTVDRRGRIWFTEQLGNKIGMLDPEKLARHPDPVPSQEKITPPWQQQAGAPRPGDGKGPPPGAPGAHGSDAAHGHHGAHPTGAPPPPGAGSAAPPVQTTPPARTPSDFRLPNPGSGPGADIIEDRKGNLWFNQIHGNRIAAFSLHTRTFREYPLPTPASMPTGIALDRRGTIWIALFRANALARLDPATGKVVEHRLPLDAALPASVTVDGRDQVWLTELGANRIARFAPEAGGFEEFEMPRPDSSPLHLIADGTDGLWISASEEGGNYVARFDLRSKTFRAYDLPTPDSSPIGLMMDGGAVWVAEGGGGKIARLSPADGTWSEYKIPASDAEPVRLARDAAGRIWATDGGGLGAIGGNRLAVLRPDTGQFELVPMRERLAKPRGILAASDGNIWFTQQNANLLSMLKP